MTGRLAAALLVGLLALAACSEMPKAAAPSTARGAVAIFAGGCFWCVEQDFEKLDGVIEAESGYIGGHQPNPSYETVSDGGTGHTEAVRVIYDPAKLSYPQLLDYFWRHIDPTTPNRQFCDRGDQYRSAIFWLDETQREAAEASRDALVRSGRFPVVYTEVAPATTFWLAEAYHQDYHKRNPLRYAYYRQGCGRDARLAKVWGSAP
jgi:peptide-methionine (S)-S-oxide reductase